MPKPTFDSSGLSLYGLRTVTEAAAIAAYEWIGRGDKEQGDAAAVHAMRVALGALPINGTVIIGEGAKDQAPELYRGERFGAGMDLPQVDIAVDPVEGTTYLAKGLTNAMAAIAIAPRGAMFDPGPAFYMEKFAAPPAAKGRINMGWSVERKLKELARILGKSIGELRVYVLEKPRHDGLVREIHAAGARVSLYPAGDVAGALMAAMPDSGVDALMGTGGTPEGILSACAIRSLGGEFMGRVNPQLQTEAAAVKAAGIDTTRWYAVEELVKAEEVFFCASGITTGLLFDGVERARHYDRVQTLMIGGAERTRQVLTNYIRRNAPGRP